jgi:hypothetical protein
MESKPQTTHTFIRILSQFCDLSGRKLLSRCHVIRYIILFKSRLSVDLSADPESLICDRDLRKYALILFRDRNVFYRCTRCENC